MDTADVDGDGALDVLVVAEADSALQWYENDGMGGYTKHTITRRVPTSITSADVDGDGDTDVLAANPPTNTAYSEVVWYENDGSPSGDGWTKNVVADYRDDVRAPDAVHVADVDRDGDTDALSIHTSNGTEGRLAWYENDGTGSFSGQNVLSKNIYSDDIDVADLDGDGDMDVVSSTVDSDANTDRVIWFENQGDATFGSMQEITERDVRAVSVADIDANGDPDILISAGKRTSTFEGVEWYENDGTPSDGGWTTHVVSDTLSETWSVRAANLDDDAEPEVVATGEYPVTGVMVHVYDSDGSPTSSGWAFRTIARGGDAGRDVGVAVGDLNGDRERDVLFRSEGDHRIMAIANEGTGSFAFPTPVTTLQNRTEASLAADLDGDGDTDILEGGDFLIWHENTGGGSFAAHPLSYRNRIGAPDTADVDGDGDLDVIAVGGQDRSATADLDGDGDEEFVETVQAVWFEGDGMGGFSRAKTLISSDDPINYLEAANLDGDAPDEVLAASISLERDFDGDGTIEADDGEVVGGVLTRHDYDGGGALSNQTIGSLEIGNDFAVGLRVADLDGDGDADALWTDSGGTSWFENQGSGSFAKSAGVTSDGLRASVFELDGDATPDVLTYASSSAGRTAYWYEWDGSGGFALRKEITLPTGPAEEEAGSIGELVGGDLNSDGVTDLVVRTGATISWNRNDGSQHFTARTISRRGVGPVSVADLDGDGNPDVLGATPDVGVTEGDLLTWYENQGLRIPAPPDGPVAQTVTPQRVPRGVEEAQLDWTASPDADVQQYVVHRETYLPLDSTKGPYYYDYAAIDTVSASQTSYTDTDPLLQADTTYRYRITAIDDIRNESNFSAEVTATPKPPLAAHTVRPASGAPGATIRIRGSSFSPTAADHTVTIGGVEAPVDSAKEAVVYARVPSAASLPNDVRGPVDVTVQTAGQTLTVPDAFTVIRGGSTTFTAYGADIAPVESTSPANAWGDYDDDGDLDLVVTGEGGSGTPSTTLYRNDNGRLTPVGAGVEDVYSGSAEWGDYDGDGRLDLLLTGRSEASSETVLVYRNAGSGTFKKVLEASRREVDGTGVAGVVGGAGTWSDYDADGDLDLTLTGYEVSGDASSQRTGVYRNDEEAMFRWGDPSRIEYRGPKEVVETMTDARGRMADWGDYNGDGHVDVIVAMSSGARIFRNEGDGSFVKVTDVGGLSRGVARWGDYDNDGDLDVAVAGQGSSGPTTKILQNKGGGTFEAINAGITGVADGPALDWGDVDGDGDLDLAVAGQVSGSPTNHVTKIFRNEGGGTFTDISADMVGVANASLDFGDVDGDGDLDLSVTGVDDSDFEPVARLYRNEAPVAANTTVVSEDGTFDFAGTGVTLDVADVSGTGTVTVQKFDSRTYDTTGVEGSLATPDRFVMTADTVSFDRVDVSVARSALGTLSDPTAVAFYKRPNTGRGAFRPLRTRLDDNGTSDVSDDTLRARADSLSEFVLGPNPFPAPPTSLSATAPADSVTLSWTASSATDVDGYYVYRERSALSVPPGPLNRQPIARVDAATTTVVDRNVRSDTTYHYRVTAVDAAGNESVFSNEDTATPTGETPGRPVVDGSIVGDRDDYLHLAEWTQTTTNEDTGFPPYFGPHGMLDLYGTRYGSRLYFNVVGELEDNGRTFLLLIDVEGQSGVAAGTAVPPGAATTGPEGAGPVDLYEATHDFEVDYGITLRSFDSTRAAMGVLDYAAETNQYDQAPQAALTIGGDTLFASTGKPVRFEGSAYEGLVGSYTNTADFSDHSGTEAWEVSIPLEALGASKGERVQVMALYASKRGEEVSPYTLPEIDGQAGTNLGRNPDFTAIRGDQHVAFQGGPDIFAPDVPDTLVADASTDDVALTWNQVDSTDAYKYRIYRDTTAIDSAAGPEGLAPIDSTVFRNDTTYVDTDVGRDTTYHYRVTAVDEADNESGLSTEATATPGDRAAPDVPAPLAATAGPDSVAVQWGRADSADVATYRVYRDTAPIDSAAGPAGRTALDTTAGGTTAYVDRAVQADTMYHYRVTAVDSADNESGFSAEATATPGDRTPPSVPTDLAAQAPADSVTLGWTAPGDADVNRYRLYRSRSPIDSTAGPAGLVPLDSTEAGTTAYVDTSARLDSTYYYRVTAVDTAANESGFSGEATATPGDQTPPDAPTGLAAGTAPDSVGLNWAAAAAADVAEYRVYRARAPIDSTAGPSVLVPYDTTGASVTTYADTSVQRDETYYYRVTAVDTAANESGFSGEVQATPGPVPSPPPRLSATAAPDRVDLNWDPVDAPDLKRYRVYRDTSTIDTTPSGLAPYDSTAAGDTTYADSGGQTGQTYHYRVTAVDTDRNESDFSEEVQATPEDTSSTGNPPPDVPTDLTATATVDTVSLNWRAVDAGDLAAYRVYRDTTPIDSAAGPSGLTPLGTSEAGTTAFEDANVQTGTTYYYRVTAVDTFGQESGLSSEVNATPSDRAAPDAPTALAATATADTVALGWTASEAADTDGYRVYRDTAPIDSSAGPAGRPPLGMPGAGTTAFEDSSVEVGTTYYYRVTAVDTLGQESGFSNGVEATPADRSPPDVPTNLAATATSDTVALDWTASEAADTDGYRVYRGTTPIDSTAGTSGYTPITTLAAGTTAFTDGNVTNGTTYYYRVTAVDTLNQESGFSNEVEATPADRTPPDAPTALAATATAEQVGLGWSPSSAADVERYRVYRSTTPIDSAAGPAERVPLDSTATSGFTDGSAQTGRAYYYRVTAVDRSGNESGFSGEARGLPYPTQVSAEVTRSFGDASGPGDYRLVALPGAPDRALSTAVSGEAGREWQAYRETGSAFQRYDGSGAFRLRTGRGFWLTARQAWAVSDSIASAGLRADTATTIPVNDGWTIVANPFEKDVAWARVVQANGGGLSALWPFGGAFSDTTATFASAAGGRAYYVLNQRSGRDSLVVPYPGALAKRGKATPKREGPGPFMKLTARPETGDWTPSAVRMGLAEDPSAEDGLIAPPGGLEAVSLRIEAPDEQSSGDDTNAATTDGRAQPRALGPASGRKAAPAAASSAPPEGRLLMADRRAVEDGGTTFGLRLTSRVEGAVRIEASRLEAVEGLAIALLDPTAQRSYDLRETPAVTITPDEKRGLTVAIGSEQYVEGKRTAVRPDEVRFTSYPNPMRQEGTVEYALPEEREVTLRVYDVLGRTVATLVRGAKEAGRHTVQIDADRLASGVYFGRLRAGEQTRTLKITVVR